MRVEFVEDGDASPLVRIFGTASRDFAALRDAATLLADGLADALDVGSLPGFEPVAGCRLVMLAGGEDAGVARTGEAMSFRWMLTPPSWLVVAGLVEPFATSADGAFQWLSGKEARYGLDGGDVAILISATSDGRW
jgi:hypothetical protein